MSALPVPKVAAGPGPATATALRAGLLPERAFRRIAALMQQASGIVLGADKNSLVYSRLARRLRVLRLQDFSAYCDFVEGGGPAAEEERARLVDALTTNVTRFFREPHHFEFAAAQLAPALLRRAEAGEPLRFWSAGCSSGEEPYSLLIALLESAPALAEADMLVLATDLNAAVLQKGRAGTYAAIGGLSPSRLSAWFAPSPCGGRTVSPALRERARFRGLNLNQSGAWPMKRPFDIIFCRNTAIYFEAAVQERLWLRLSEQLRPGGHLFIGHSERVTGPAEAMLQPAGAATAFLRTDSITQSQKELRP